ncbi:hypothetical protein [Flavobacterium sp.]|uniref:hypothetical protein n=1 Tax=Flavobacterium sp. TaxID=239 RepID=UPI0025BA4455|nr:hypothetical protein [Flavobacterium sp.]
MYCFEKKGVLENSDDDDSVVQELNFELYSQLRRSAKIHSGMLPKLENCFRALQNGVESVKIGDIDLLKNEHSGTQILLY